jgi:hypothetical protein
MPPVPAKVAAYADPCVPAGSEAVETARVLRVTMTESVIVADTGGVSESVTCTVKELDATALGVPVMIPVRGARYAQVGNEDPVAMLQV